MKEYSNNIDLFNYVHASESCHRSWIILKLVRIMILTVMRRMTVMDDGGFYISFHINIVLLLLRSQFKTSSPSSSFFNLI